MSSSSGVLRHRLPVSENHSNSSMNTRNNSSAAGTNDDEDDNEAFSRRSGLGAQYLIRGAPIHHQSVLKLHAPFIFRISPVWLKKYLCQVGICKSWLQPQWVPRHLILLGSFLYRYTNEYSSSPKGTPIALEQIVGLALIPIDEGDTIEGLEYAVRSIPFGCQAMFSIESSPLFRKTQYYAVSTTEDAQVWVNSVIESKQESITRSMGHSKVPVPQSWEYYDRLAKKYIQSKESIKARISTQNKREFELVGMQSPQGTYS